MYAPQPPHSTVVLLPAQYPIVNNPIATMAIAKNFFITKPFSWMNPLYHRLREMGSRKKKKFFEKSS